MKLTIDRSKWLRGEANSCLLRPSDGKMCCLGFYALSVGLSPEKITDISTPVGIPLDSIYETRSQLWGEGKWLFVPTNALAFLTNAYTNSRTYGGQESTSADSSDLMKYNDCPNLNPNIREERIKEIFAKHDVEVEFIN